MAKRELPDPELLRKLLRYDPETGKLYWRERPQEMFSEEWRWKGWNTQYAHQEAFKTIDQTGYFSGRILTLTIRAHRIVWALVNNEWPQHEIDHLNGDKLDNRIGNLRDVPHRINCQNRKRRSDNTSGISGVSWHKKTKKWRARVYAGGTRIYLGYFDTVEAAAIARQTAMKKLGYHPNHGRHSAATRGSASSSS
jgi:hypothetical protein